MTRRKATLSGLLAVAAMTLLSSCSAATGDQNGGWAIPDVPDALPMVTQATVLPLDGYRLGRAERERLQEGTAVLLQQCLDTYGVTADIAGDYIQQVSDDPTVRYPPYAWGGKLGTLPIEQAREYAYIAPPDAEWSNAPGIYLSHPSNIYAVPHGDAVQVAQLDGAMYGPDHAVVLGEGGQSTPLDPALIPTDASGALPPEHGCIGAVEDEIGVPFVDVRDAEADTANLAMSDERFLTRQEQWSRCMHDAGYPFKRVQESFETNAGGAGPEQIAAAVKDVECTRESAWPNLYYFLVAEYEEQAIAKNPELFQAALGSERERLARVDELVSE